MQCINRNGVCVIFFFFLISLGFLFLCPSVREASPSRCAPSGSGTGGGSCDFSPASWRPRSPPGTQCSLLDNGAVGLCLTPLPLGPGVKGFLFPRDTAETPLVTRGGPRRRGGSDGRSAPLSPPRPSPCDRRESRKLLLSPAWTG